MIKRGALLIVLVFLVGYLHISCKNDESIRYDDFLVRIDSSVISVQEGLGGGSKGVYVLFFENRPTRIAYTDQVSVKFDESLSKPIVEAMLRTSDDHIPNEGKLFNVVITFKNREQMNQYWFTDEGE